MIIAVLDSSAFWSAIASGAAAVALWAQKRAHKPTDPIEDLTDRIRNPKRRALWAARHPLRAWKSR